MNRIGEKLVNLVGSVGIAALAVAILLAPYNELNAAASSSSCQLGTCSSTNDGKSPPVCGKTGYCDPTSCACQYSGPTLQYINGKYYWVCKAWCS